MKNLKILISLIIIEIINSKTEGVFFPKRGNALLLSELTYEEALNEYQYMFIQAFAEWCSTCKRVEVELHKVIDYFENNIDTPNIGFGMIYGTYNRNFMQKFNVPGYPYLALFSGNIKIKEYVEEFKYENIVPWIRKFIYPTIQEIKDELTFNIILNNKDISKVIAYYGNDKNTLNILEKSALSHPKYTFIKVLNKTLMKLVNAKENDIVLYKNFDDLNNTLNIPIDYEKTEKFIDKYSHKLFKPFNLKKGRKIFSKKRNLLLFMMKNRKEKNIEEEKERENICKELRDKVQCITTIYDEKEIERYQKILNTPKRKEDPYNNYPHQIIEEDQFENNQNMQFLIDLYTSLQIKNNTETEIFLFDFSNKISYAYNIENNEKKILTFMKNWYENKLDNKTIKIKLPSSIKNNVIKTNVDKFDRDVINNNFDVLVKFYAPWCGHCKRLAPIYDKLANFYSEKNKRIKFVEVDATTNEIPGFIIEGYPTIYLFKRNDKSHPVLYTGEDNYGDISKFIDEEIRKK